MLRLRPAARPLAAFASAVFAFALPVSPALGQAPATPGAAPSSAPTATTPVSPATTAPAFTLREGDRVVFLGDTLIEREQYHGWIELMLTARFADKNITFRNLGWSADTPTGDSRFGLSLLQAGREPADEGWTQLIKQIEEAKPTVVFVGYGMANSLAGDGIEKFKADYARLLATIEKTAPGARLVLLSPVRHEGTGGSQSVATTHNTALRRYAVAIREAAVTRGANFVSLFYIDDPAQLDAKITTLTDNGIHPHGAGYRKLAELIETQLFLRQSPSAVAPAWRTSPQVEPLRQAILRKNEWFFHRSRPANMAYIFGFRKREQGRNATEVLQFDEFIAAEEKRIAQLRSLQPVNVPEIPRRIGNKLSQPTPQPHPEFQVADGFEVSLWAENPLLNKPIQMNFDARGRLWVASSELYPQIEPGQAATDKIIVLEDTTGAGRADKATVFADGLLIPTGLEMGDGGVYVAQSTELLHFRDTDGDGKADQRRVVLSGFGTEDTHHNLHTLRWGPDGRLYLNQAVYTRTDTETPHGVVRLKAGGTFRLDPRDLKMEILFRGWVNSWGHQFDAYGQSFATDGAGFQGINWAVPGATYFTLAPARRVLQSVSPGNFPKFAGIEIVRSPQFPDDWQGDVITADFRAHRIVHFKLTDQGAGYLAKETTELLRTTADSFRPVDMRFGPDGALYIADWSNPIIQHGEVDFRDVRRDKIHGRIWRIAAKGRPLVPRSDLTTLANAALLDRLVTPHSFENEKAKRVLVERGAEKVLPDLTAWLAKQPASSELARLNALWLYQAFNQIPRALQTELLSAKDARVRAAATRTLGASTPTDVLAKLVADENPRVRLEAVRALGRQSSASDAALALTVLDRPMDPFLDYALWLTINELATPWLAAVKSGAWKIDGREKQLEFALKALEPAQASEVLGQLLAARGLPADGSGPWIELIGAAGSPAELRRLFDAVLERKLDEPAARRAVLALNDAARLRNARPSGDLAVLRTVLESPERRPVATAAIKLVGGWKQAAFTPTVLTLAGAPATSDADRAEAFAALRDLGGAPVIAGLKQVASSAATPAIRRDAVTTLAALDLGAALPEVIAVLQATTDETQAQALWRTLLGIRGASTRLAAELGKTTLPAAVARAGLRPAREGNQHAALVPVLIKAAGLTLSSQQLSPAELSRLAQDALVKGDAARGEHLYRRADLACVVCHAIGGAGGKLGPDLTSIGASAPPDYLVESLLYPGAKIKEGYHSVLLSTKDGQEHNGMIVRETATEILLRNAANQEVSIPAASVTRRTSVGSLMPAGLLDSLLPEEQFDLIKFLAQLGKPGDYDAAKGGVARSWKLYLILSVNEHLGTERVVRGDFSLNDWQPALSLVNGALPKEAVELTYPSRNNNRGLFAGTRFEAPRTGKVTFTLANHTETKGVWVNGVALKPAPQFTVEANAGPNALVIQLNDVKPADIKLTSPDVTFLTP